MTQIPTPVVLLHDAAIDEYMATVLLTTMAEVELLGVIVVNGDCIATPAMNAAARIQLICQRPDIPLALSRARGWNPFPWPYRGDCIKENELPMLAALPPLDPPYADGEALLRQLLTDAQEPVTLLCTGPLTPLQMVLDVPGGPDLAAKIGRLVWMGGAINVAGNLDPATLPQGVANPYAEWNVFWDPYAADWVFRNTNFPISLFPLDITNTAAITPDFLSTLLRQGKDYPLSNLAFQSYNIVAAESFYDMWDVTATVWLAHPEFYEDPSALNLVVKTEGEGMQGALVQREDGRAVDAYLAFARKQEFYDYVAEQLVN